MGSGCVWGEGGRRGAKASVSGRSRSLLEGRRGYIGGKSCKSISGWKVQQPGGEEGINRGEELQKHQ
jgi:hypothetical protein